MAKVKVEMPEEFLRKLSLLGSKTDEIAGRVLEAGGEVVLSKVRSNLSSATTPLASSKRTYSPAGIIQVKITATTIIARIITKVCGISNFLFSFIYTSFLSSFGLNSLNHQKAGPLSS